MSQVLLWHKIITVEIERHQYARAFYARPPPPPLVSQPNWVAKISILELRVTNRKNAPVSIITLAVPFLSFSSFGGMGVNDSIYEYIYASIKNFINRKRSPHIEEMLTEFTNLEAIV